MSFDLILTNALLAGRDMPCDIGIRSGCIAAIAPDLNGAEGTPCEDLGRRLLSPGLVDSHVHLDKACILERCPICEGTLPEAVQLTAAAKAGFTEEDVYARARRVLEKAILNGTQRMRSFVEVDPRVGMRSFRALLRLKSDYSHAIDLELCAFAQEGLTQEMETHELLERACREGADLVGGCPYTDADPARHVALIFDLAEKHGMAVDFHIDFDLDPAKTNLPCVIEETKRRGYAGRVSIGHVTQFSAMSPEAMAEAAARLADAGIALCVLPATDLFLLGRDSDRLVPRGLTPAHRLKGVTTALATNNVLNPFTPYGDASLIRMANFYANVSQAAQDRELERIFSMITDQAARILGSDLRLEEGAAADFVLIDAPDPVAALREVAPVLGGWKAGRKTFERPAARLL